MSIIFSGKMAISSLRSKYKILIKAFNITIYGRNTKKNIGKTKRNYQ